MQNNDENQSLFEVTQERLFNGIFKENPTFVLLLGMCPTLAVTTSAINGLGMGVTTMVVLMLSNMFISMLRKLIPDKIRIPAFIVIIASFVTIVELLLKAYIPFLYAALGIYIPLIVVNCIILGRAEAYAYTHPVIPSLFDGIGMGLGFTFALTIIGSIREILGSGTIFDYRIMPYGYVPVSIFVMAPGAFFVLALLTAIQNKIKMIGENRGKDMSKIQSGCAGDCAACNITCDSRNKDAGTDEAAPAPAPADNEESVNESSENETGSTEEEKEEKPAEDDKNEEPVTAEKKDKSSKKEKRSFADRFRKNKEKDKEKVKEPAETEEKETNAEDMPEVKEESEANVESEANFESDVKTESDEKAESDAKDESEVNVESDVNAEPEDTGVSEENEKSLDEEDTLEFLNLNDYRKMIGKSGVTGRRPQRKRSSEKAEKLLMNAEKKMKEDEKND